MRTEEADRTCWDTMIFVIILLCQSVFVLALLNYFVGGLRFTSLKANYQAFAVASVLPILACIAFFVAIPRYRRRGHQWMSLILSLLGLSALFVELLAVWYLTEWFMYPIAKAPHLQPEQRIAWNGATITVWKDVTYDDTLILVLQDVKVAGPLNWRRQLASFSRAEVTVTPLDSRRLQCKVLEAGTEPPDYEGVEREVILRVD